jgi:phosphotransferase system  glucose/maltose/N-acetylglucosamine-specific IIC component
MPTTVILKNRNFLGIVISNLLIGICIIFFQKSDDPSNFSLSLCMSIVTISVYFILFKKVHFEKKADLKLFLYSLLTYIIIFFLGIILWCCVNSIFTDYPTDLSHMISGTILLVITGFLVTLPCILIFTFINFFWLLKERKDRIKLTINH